MATALLEGARRGKLDLSRGQACIDAALEGGSQEVAAQLIDAVGRGYHALANDSALGTMLALQARLAILGAIYVERPSGKDGDPKTTDRIFAQLRRKFWGGRFGAVGLRAGQRGSWAWSISNRDDTEDGRSTSPRLTAWPRATTRRCCSASRIDSPHPGSPGRGPATARPVADRCLDLPGGAAEAAAVEARVMQQGINRVLAGRPAVLARLAERLESSRCATFWCGRTCRGNRRPCSAT